MLTAMMIQARKCRAEGKCPSCKKLVDLSTFVDELSRREFAISGLCQVCQDEVFRDEDEDDDNTLNIHG